MNLIKPNQSYPVWSPYDAIEAASTMLEAVYAARAVEAGNEGKIVAIALKAGDVVRQ
jgi:hypothetical protein